MAYAAIAVALTWPLAPRLGTAVPNDLGDPLLNTWILWWNSVTVPFSTAWWNAPAFFPTEGVLTLSEHLLGLTPIASPVYWLTGNMQLGYNVVLLTSFPLSAFFGFLLCRELTGRTDAAFIGGLLFGFTPYRMAQLAHVQVLCSYWMPLALWALHRYLREARNRWLVVFAGAWLMQALANGYFMVFFSVLIAGWMAWFVLGRDWRRTAGIAMAGGLAALPIVPIVLEYREVHERFGLRRGVDDIQQFSADILSFLDHTDRLAFWDWLPAFHRAEGELFPGITGLLIAAAGLWISRARATAGDTGACARWSRLRTGVRIGTAVFAAVAASAWLLPWAVEIGGWTISARRVLKPLTLAAIGAIALLLTHPRVRRAFRGRTVLGFYALAAPLMWLLSLGPRPTLLGVQALFQGPYAWLMALPGLDTLRVPARFHMVAVLCLSCAAAICLARLLARCRRSVRVALVAGATVTALADTWVLDFPIEPAPAPWAVQAWQTREPSIEVPLGGIRGDVEAMYRSMWSRSPVVNGYSGYELSWYRVLDRALQAHDPGVLNELAAHGVRQLLVNTTAEGGDGWVRYLAGRPDIVMRADDGRHRLYDLPPVPATGDRALGAPLEIASIHASVNGDRVRHMTDGDLASRWDGGPQQGTEVVTLDLGGPMPVVAVVLSLGPFGLDAPQHLVIEASEDGAAWTEVWRGAGAGPVLRASFRDPRRVPAAFDIGDRTARYLRLRQTGAHDTIYWSIAEIAVLGPKR